MPDRNPGRVASLQRPTSSKSKKIPMPIPKRTLESMQPVVQDILGKLVMEDLSKQEFMQTSLPPKVEPKDKKVEGALLSELIQKT